MWKPINTLGDKWIIKTQTTPTFRITVSCNVTVCYLVDTPHSVIFETAAMFALRENLNYINSKSKFSQNTINLLSKWRQVSTQRVIIRPITLVNTQNVSVTKIVDSSSIQCAESKYSLRIQFLALVRYMKCGLMRKIVTWEGICVSTALPDGE